LHFNDLNWERHRYSGLKSYGAAKTAQLLSMLIFDEAFRGSGVTINTMHPGAVKTDTGQENGRFYQWYKRNFLDKGLRSADISAEALYYLGVAGALDGISGKFINLTTIEDPAPPAVDKEAARQLWNETLKIAGLT
jgi:NAD(P)-dependent dehydrogenase (short-subunit alcohol dehydrogenase family)